MKKLKVLLGLVLFGVLLSLGSFKEVHAEVTLVPGESTKMDLDGDGIDEKISYSISKSSNQITVKIYVNDSLKYSGKEKINDEYYKTDVSIYDINPDDKYGEIVVDIRSEYDHKLYAYRYKSNKLKLLFKAIDISFENKLLPDQKKGNKVLMYDASTCALGNHITTIKNYKIKNKKLVEVPPKSQIYTVDEDADGYERWYIAAKDLTVYKSSDGKKAVSTIKEGTEFKISKLQFIDGEATYAMVNIKNGKKSAGWINVYYDPWNDDWDNHIVENPGFAG